MSETRYQGRRLIVRRARLTDTDRATPWPDWRHFAFLTDLDGEATELNAFHRCHAVVELTIRDLKEGAGLEHLPSGRCEANGAWLACAVLAHILVRWTATIGQPDPVEALTGARSLRYPARRRGWPGGQPGRDADPARPTQVAMARRYLRRPRRPAPVARSQRLTHHQRRAHRRRSTPQGRTTRDPTGISIRRARPSVPRHSNRPRQRSLR